MLEDLPGMRVIKDPQTGELAVWAKASQHEKLSEVLEQLKATGESTDKLLLISYTINSGSAKAVFDMLQELFPGIKISLDEKSDRILVYAPVERARTHQADDCAAGCGRNAQQPGRAPILLDRRRRSDPDHADVAEARAGHAADNRPRGQEADRLGQRARPRSPGESDQAVSHGRPRRSGRSSRPTRCRAASFARCCTCEVCWPRWCRRPSSRSIRAVEALLPRARKTDHRKLKEAIDEIVKLDRSADYQLETYALDKLTATQAITTLRPIVPDAEISAGVDQRQIVVWASPKITNASRPL